MPIQVPPFFLIVFFFFSLLAVKLARVQETSVPADVPSYSQSFRHVHDINKICPFPGSTRLIYQPLPYVGQIFHALTLVLLIYAVPRKNGL